MNIDMIDNICMLLTVVIGLLISLFRYIENPKRGYLLLSVYFLAHLLSDYYWALFSLVMKAEPEVSAFIAYFGWNVGYIFLLIIAYKRREPGAKRLFHPLMLLPIPINMRQLVNSELFQSNPWIFYPNQSTWGLFHS